MDPPDHYNRYCPPVPVEDYATSFAALSRLHTLRLRECRNIENLLPHVARAPVLRRLTIEPVADSSWFQLSQCCPSAADLISLLKESPQLHAVLAMPLPWTGVHAQPALDFMEQVASVIGGRFELQTVE